MRVARFCVQSDQSGQSVSPNSRPLLTTRPCFRSTSVRPSLSARMRSMSTCRDQYGRTESSGNGTSYTAAAVFGIAVDGNPVTHVSHMQPSVGCQRLLA